MSLLLALAASIKSGPSTPIDPFDRSLLVKRRHIATNVGWHRGAGVSPLDQWSTVITRHVAPSPASNISIRMGLHHFAGLGAGVTCRWHIVHAGAIHRVTWGGEHETHIPLQREPVDSDQIGPDLLIRGGDEFYSVAEYPPGEVFPYRYFTMDTPQRALINGSLADNPALDFKMTETGISGSPVAIMGDTTADAKSVALLGDSILESGWGRRAADANGVAWADWSEWAQPIPTQGIGGRALPTDQPMFTLGISQYGTNNLDTPDRNDRLVSFWYSMVEGPFEKLAQTTMVPYVSGADSTNLGTLDGQVWSPGRNEHRNTLNNWLRDGAPIIAGKAATVGDTGAGVVRIGDVDHPLIGIIDVSPVTDAINSRGETVWRVDLGTPSADGVHPTRAGADLMEPLVAQWIADHI